MFSLANKIAIITGGGSVPYYYRHC